MLSDKTAFRETRKILIIKLRHIGDVLLTVPTLRAFKETFPGADISVLVNSGTEDALAGNPVIDELLVFDRKTKSLPPAKKYMNEIRFLKNIRARGFDMTVDLTGGDRAAIVSFMSGARYRLALDPGNQGFFGKRYLYTHLTCMEGSKHMVLQNLDMAGRFGISTDNTDVDFFIPEDIKASVKEKLAAHNIKERDTLVHIHPTSRWMFKCWDDKYMAEIIGWLLDNHIKVVVTSAPFKNELDRANNIISFVEARSSSAGLVNLCGKTSIKELAAISDASDLFIGVDTAPMHIAAAVKTPVIALFGPSGEKEWGPYGKGHIVVTKNLPCKPCTKGMCEGIQLRECMSAIKPRDVKQAVLKMLDLKKVR